MGDTVNIASRVQGATKYLGTDCLLTETTRAGLAPCHTLRRLACVKVVNIAQPLDLYELTPSPPEGWTDQCRRYQEVLTALEQKNLSLAADLAARFCRDFPEDTAAQALNQRVREAQLGEAEGGSSIWQLPGK